MSLRSENAAGPDLVPATDAEFWGAFDQLPAPIRVAVAHMSLDYRPSDFALSYRLARKNAPISAADFAQWLVEEDAKHARDRGEQMYGQGWPPVVP